MEASPASGAVVLLTRLSRTVYRLVGNDLPGLTLKQFVTLNYLRDTPGTTQGALGEAMCIDANNLVLLLNSLEEAGLAVRERDPEDRRRHRVSITPAGVRAVARGDRAIEGVTDQVLDNLDEDERTALRGLLAKALGDRALVAAP